MHKSLPRYIEMSLDELKDMSETPLIFHEWIRQNGWHRRYVMRSKDLDKAKFIRRWFAKFEDNQKKENIIKRESVQMKLL